MLGPLQPVPGSQLVEANEKNQTIQGERARERGLRPSSFFPRSPAARRADPLTEGLEQDRSTPKTFNANLRLFLLTTDQGE